MQILAYFPLLAVLLALVSLKTVAGDESYAVRTLLNHGYSLSTNETCSSSEWDSITTAMDNAASRRRGLRQRQRGLTHYFCDIVCQAYPPGTCYLVYPACRNRRHLTEGLHQDVVQEEGAVSTSSNIEQQRELAEEQTTRVLLVNNAICQMKIGAINTALNDLIPSLSQNCQAVVGSSRDFECYEVHIISGWNLWDADSNTIITPSFPELGQVCRKLNFSIEAIIPEDAEISFVSFVLKGPNNYSKLHVEQQTKWFMFGNNGNNVFGQVLSTPGTYTVTATPNGDSTMERSLSFTVVDC